jgi:hypothetical protein
MQLLGNFSYHSTAESFQKISDLIVGICKNVPVYQYGCVKDKSAVELLKNELLSL